MQYVIHELAGLYGNTTRDIIGLYPGSKSNFYDLNQSYYSGSEIPMKSSIILYFPRHKIKPNSFIYILTSDVFPIEWAFYGSIDAMTWTTLVYRNEAMCPKNMQSDYQIASKTCRKYQVEFPFENSHYFKYFKYTQYKNSFNDDQNSGWKVLITNWGLDVSGVYLSDVTHCTCCVCSYQNNFLLQIFCIFLFTDS